MRERPNKALSGDEGLRADKCQLGVINIRFNGLAGGRPRRPLPRKRDQDSEN